MTNPKMTQEEAAVAQAYERFPDIVVPDDCHPLGKITQDNGSMRYAFLEGARWGISRSSEMLSQADMACQKLCGNHGFATGHGDTIADMIGEIDGQIAERHRSTQRRGGDAR